MNQGTEEALENWGRWCKTWREHQGYPSISPMFANAPISDWWEDGWGQVDAEGKAIEKGAPEYEPPINIKSAEMVDKLIGTMRDSHRLMLAVEYGWTPRVFRNKRKKYEVLLAESVRAFEDLLIPAPDNKKATVINLLIRQRDHAALIARMAKCSREFVRKIETMLSLHAPPKKKRQPELVNSNH